MARQGAKQKRRSKAGFQIVPANSTEPSKGSVRKKKKVGVNTLRDAHKASMPSKADELWFRKCGYGEALFREYYLKQGIVPASDQASFLATLQRPLPVTFRVHPHSAAGREAVKRLRALAEATAVGRAPVVQQVSWAPLELGMWQANVPLDKRSLSAEGGGVDPAASTRLSELLLELVGRGGVSRQEAVSMLPVLALRVQPGSFCVDLCAAPGSKTMQLLEHTCSHSEPHKPALVVANDANPSRVATLQHTIARHCRPSTELESLAFTCHAAERFPLPSRPFAGRSRVGFDRVLADVPCSGDGTVRKDRSVLPRWTPALANHLHSTQLDIAWRALELVRVGGRMVYSTCSLNPVEDEAVVCALLARAHSLRAGAVELEKWPSDLLPSLKRRPGVREWRVADHVLTDDDEALLRFHGSEEEAREAGMERVAPSMWPCRDHDVPMPLHRCSRILSHDQDTGGFFIAIFRKRAELPAAIPPTTSRHPHPSDPSIYHLATTASTLHTAAAPSSSRTHKDSMAHVSPGVLDAFDPGVLHLIGRGSQLSPSSQASSRG